MTKTSLKIAVAASAIALVAGCGKKAPEQLPPPPVDNSRPTAPIGQGASTGRTTIVPGSRGDFLRSVPSDRVLFETDSFSLDDEDRATLDAQAAWLARNSRVQVTIEGHADERGTREYNLALGDRRANAAKNYLQSRGVAASRMNVVSWGKERPIALGSDERAWAQNRRAVTVIPE
jgi:peptidoglycan-associated lipoprotein